MTQEQKQRRSFQGAMTALVTPFRRIEGPSEPIIDEKAFSDLCEQQIQSGISGLVVCGTTGESPTLSDAEKERLFRLTVEIAHGRVLVIAGVGSNHTAHALLLGHQAKKAGVDGLLAVTPYYNRPTQEGLFAHYQSLVNVGLPTILYNVPGRTGCDLLPETMAKLCQFPEIVAVKEATGSVQRAQQIIGMLGDRLPVLSGDDAINFPLYCIGAMGCISVVSNLAPALVSKIWNLFSQSNISQAKELHISTLPLTNALFAQGESSPVPVKTALHLLGYMQSEVRLPLSPMKESSKQRLKETLLAQGLLP